MLANFRRARNLQRYRKIVAVLARHGFGSILEYLQVNRYLPLSPVVTKQNVKLTSLSPAEHLRLALEELGPTFIKLGQILSTRPDLVPPEYIVELTKLQEGVPPTAWEAIWSLLNQEYDAKPEEFFPYIDPEPIGSASLSQVHAARLADGSEVVLKIQRPNIIRTIQADLDILTDLAALAQRTPWGQLYNPVEIVSHFAYTLYNELDFRREATNADRFRVNFSQRNHLYIPKVYLEFTTQRVLVLERLYGVKINDLDGLDAAGFDRRQIALNAADIIVKETMEDGFFHADPHPGNFVIFRDDESNSEIIGAMDFGMVGFLSKSERINLLQGYIYMANDDAKGLAELMLRIGAVSSNVDLQLLETDIDRLFHQYRNLPVRNIQTPQVLEEIMQLAFRHRLNLPTDLWLLFKTMMMMDGLARQLDPDVNLFVTIGAPVKRLALEMRMPWTWGPTFISDLESLAFALKDLPSIGESVLRGLQRGQIPVKITTGVNKESLDRLDRIGTRFSISILVAAFILGMALLLPVSKGNVFAEILISFGFLASVALGIWLVISILRAGR